MVTCVGVSVYTVYIYAYMYVVYSMCINIIIYLGLLQPRHLINPKQSTKESSTIVIRLTNEQTSRDSQGFNNAGRVSAYILTYQVQALIIKNNIQLGKV